MSHSKQPRKHINRAAHIIAKSLGYSYDIVAFHYQQSYNSVDETLRRLALVPAQLRHS